MPKISPRILKCLLNLYGPYLGAGVRVKYISPDWKELQVEMGLHWYNQNAYRTHFGGSLYSMVDPHLVLLLIQILGKNYVIWDKAAEIEFVKPGRGRVSSAIHLSEEAIAEIQQGTASGKAYLPEFFLEVLDEAGEVVARIRKVLYVRRKP